MNILFAQQKQIVIAADAPFLLRCAAKKLSDHLGIPYVTDATPATEGEILLGNTNRLSKEVRVRNDICRVLYREERVVFAAVHYQPICEMIDRIIGKKIEGFDPEAEPMQISSRVPLYFGERKLVWNDEFDGDTLDIEKWIGRAYMDTPDVVMTMNPGVVDVTDGKLVLTTHMLDRRDPVARYLTNYAITTAATMNFLHGYMEIRAKVPHYDLGEWPSWWFLTGHAKWAEQAWRDEHDGKDREIAYGVEVDGYEVFSNRHGITPNLHKWHKGASASEQLSGIDQGKSKNGTRSYCFTPDEDVNDWHTYGFLWTPEKMAFSVDGYFYYSYDITKDFGKSKSGMQDFDQPFFVLFNNMLFTEGNINRGGYWAKNLAVKSEDLFPLFYQLDYVRLYQMDGERLFVPSEAGQAQWLEPTHYDKREHGIYRSSTPEDYANGMPYKRGDLKKSIMK